MNGQQIAQRALALHHALHRTTVLDEVRTLAAEMQRLHDGQCLACYCSEDDAIHQSRPRRWLCDRPAACSYVARVPVHLRSVQTLLLPELEGLA